MLPKEYGAGSTSHRRFQVWVELDIFKKMWVKLLKLYDDKEGIKLIWQSLDSISIKSSLGRQRPEIILPQIEANWAQKDIF